MLDISIKTFNQLSLEELYYLLQLRSEVFVVEQDCVYQDVDGKDQNALHVIGKKDNRIIAYTRIFKAGDYFKEASIGRVVVSEKERHLKYGHQLMLASIKAIETSFYTKKIKLSAQKYLEKFYTNLGFKTIGEPYLEDGIPHIAMVKN
ncbi:acetyltransferase, GNAT family [Formosa sp. Hel1_33_131]|jgi:ElaA protein|uniref:GNAT family N-acetyltransferase n=1 Tax=Formosa sp. Hel1_33_131 TaxID=1336794 RepID=UPI00084E0FD5|nr:GNAT family N-acetyltransferase [Formosa sp. Hel1_33_131]AOR28295.1 acetyltransferase, GNAT family [Formosa sp. Hel1_33_131]